MLDPEEVRSHSGSIQSFLAAHPTGKVLLLHTQDTRTYRAVSPRVLIAPLAAVI